MNRFHYNFYVNTAKQRLYQQIRGTWDLPIAETYLKDLLLVRVALPMGVSSAIVDISEAGSMRNKEVLAIQKEAQIRGREAGVQVAALVISKNKAYTEDLMIVEEMHRETGFFAPASFYDVELADRWLDRYEDKQTTNPAASTSQKRKWF